MERISIFNYEVFYLDYLEGNLSSEDTQMLMQFLEEHPECRLEEEEMPVLDADEPLLYANKNDLKQVANSDAIALNNVEHFMIAESEGLLQEEKIKELNAFVAGNAYLEATRKRYASVYFEADHAVVYADKKGLKQSKKLVLWPYVSGAVAAAVIAFVFLGNLGQLEPVKIDFAFDSINFNAPDLGLTTEPVKDPVEIKVKDMPRNTIAASTQKTPVRTKRISDAIDHQRLATKPTTGTRTFFDKQKLMPVNQVDPANISANLDGSMAQNTTLPNNNQVQASSGMNNPIAPITQFITKKSNTDVDFGQRKTSTVKKGGFYLKIGKFELSRNKH